MRNVVYMSPEEADEIRIAAGLLQNENGGSTEALREDWQKSGVRWRNEAGLKVEKETRELQPLKEALDSEYSQALADYNVASNDLRRRSRRPVDYTMHEGLQIPEKASPEEIIRLHKTLDERIDYKVGIDAARMALERGTGMTDEIRKTLQTAETKAAEKLRKAFEVKEQDPSQMDEWRKAKRQLRGIQGAMARIEKQGEQSS
ncbi:MAG: hypothetical protein NUV81_00475 [bacterium]|nr:hypothetical protein [bacterium]